MESSVLRLARKPIENVRHNLSSYWDKYQDDWSMKFAMEHHGDVYPTHGIGPYGPLQAPCLAGA